MKSTAGTDHGKPDCCQFAGAFWPDGDECTGLVIGLISETQRNLNANTHVKAGINLSPAIWARRSGCDSAQPPPTKAITVPLLRESSLKSTTPVPNRITGELSVLYNPIGRLRKQLFVPETKLIGNAWLCGWERLRL